MNNLAYTKISVLIPFHGQDEWRLASLDWVRKRWNLQLAALGIDHEIIVDYDNQDSFNKCRAFNNAARQASGDLFILSDADVFLTQQTLEIGLRRISQVDNYYTYPYKYVERLNQAATSAYHNRQADCPIAHGRQQIVKRHVDTGGVILVDADAFATVRGLDERFNSVYGGEMVSFTTSIKRVFGQVNRVQHTLYHLWHPKFKRNTPERRPNKQLWHRYKHAKNRDQMMKIIAEREKL